MAPEILRYEKYDAKADLWSVGAVLFEMSVGKPPFRAQNHVDLLRKIERGEDRIKFPDEKRLEEGVERPNRVQDDLKGLIRKLLKRTPLERMGFEDFFLESGRVAEGGSASGLISAEAISLRYAKPTLSPTIPSNSTTPILPPIETEAAFLTSSTTARSTSTVPVPSPTIRNPYSEGTERPAFARKSEDTALSRSPVGLTRAPSFQSNYPVARSSSTATETGVTSGKGFLVTQNVPSKGPAR